MTQYYKTTITLTVLSEDPLEGSPLELSEIVGECTDGGYVMHSEWRKTEEVSADQMATLLIDAGSEPGFFMLDDAERIVGGIGLSDDEVLSDDRIHKAKPAKEFADDAQSTCIHCHSDIKRVPGGQGPTWVHTATGAVVGSGPAITKGEQG